MILVATDVVGHGLNIPPVDLVTCRMARGITNIALDTLPVPGVLSLLRPSPSTRWRRGMSLEGWPAERYPTDMGTVMLEAECERDGESGCTRVGGSVCLWERIGCWEEKIGLEECRGRDVLEMKWINQMR